MERAAVEDLGQKIISAIVGYPISVGLAATLAVAGALLDQLLEANPPESVLGTLQHLREELALHVAAATRPRNEN